nr:hypothetical protein Q903MT_gene2343 [Picea sitchensis]
MKRRYELNEMKRVNPGLKNEAKELPIPIVVHMPEFRPNIYAIEFLQTSVVSQGTTRKNNIAYSELK